MIHKDEVKLHKKKDTEHWREILLNLGHVQILIQSFQLREKLVCLILHVCTPHGTLLLAQILCDLYFM